MYVFGLHKEKHYDMLVVAPGWKPTKIIKRKDIQVTCTMEHSYLSGYEVTVGEKSIAWIQSGSGSNSTVDQLLTCAELNFDKLVFVGSVGALTADIGLGDLCTPEWSIAGSLANGYLEEDITQYIPFQKVYPNDPNFVAQVGKIAQDMG